MVHVSQEEEWTSSVNVVLASTNLSQADTENIFAPARQDGLAACFFLTEVNDNPDI